MAVPEARRIAFVLTVVSLLTFCRWELTRSDHNAFMDLSGKFTDHFSHMNAGRLFFRFGADVWRVPLDQQLSPPSPAEREALPADVQQCPDCLFIVPGWDKPVLQSWPTVVRFYPPGDMVLTAPVAALYHYTSLSATNANRLLLLIFLGAAHVGLFMLLDGLLGAPAEIRHSSLLAVFLGVSCVLRWTLEGFYDGAILCPLLLCFRYLGERRGLAAIVAFCAAAFLHFRAYYYAPCVITAVVLVIREEQWRSFRPRDWAAAATAVCLGGASLLTYWLALPGLLAFRGSESLLLLAPGVPIHGTAFAATVVIGAIAIAAFVAARSPLDIAMLAWIGLVLTQVRQTFAWYPVAVVPWLVSVPRLGRPAMAPLVLQARVLVFLFLTLYIHVDDRSIVETVLGTWIFKVIRGG